MVRIVRRVYNLPLYWILGSAKGRCPRTRTSPALKDEAQAAAERSGRLNEQELASCGSAQGKIALREHVVRVERNLKPPWHTEQSRDRLLQSNIQACFRKCLLR